MDPMGTRRVSIIAGLNVMKTLFGRISSSHKTIDSTKNHLIPLHKTTSKIVGAHPCVRPYLYTILLLTKGADPYQIDQNHAPYSINPKRASQSMRSSFLFTSRSIQPTNTEAGSRRLRGWSSRACTPRHLRYHRHTDRQR